MKRAVLTLEIAAAFLMPAFLYWAAWVWPVLPFGSLLFTRFGMLLPLGSLFALVVAVASAISLIRRRSGPRTIRGLACGVAAVAGTAAGMWLGLPHRMKRITHVTESAMSLVQAIDEFERRENRPPRQLSELVPNYLSAVPGTGMGGYPDWEYRAGSEGREYAGNRWILLVHTGGPGINFDQLLYFPNRQYPAAVYGGRIERVGAWAYVHE